MQTSRPFWIAGIFLLFLLLPAILGATRVFRVQETDFVKIIPRAVDPDNDVVRFNFSLPLDEQGEWQTGYEDAGEYQIEITASDGESKSVEKVELIVENKNQPPLITEKKLIVKERQTVDLREIVKDADGDVLTFTFNPPFNADGKWNTTYEDSGPSVTEFTVSDAEFTVKGKVEIEVLNTNQPPFIKETFSADPAINIKEGESLKLSAESIDIDGDEITYQWFLDGKTLIAEKKGEAAFDYNSSGVHLLKLSVSDGMHSTEKQWNVHVKNFNRRPSLDLIPITVQEGETVIVDLPRFDADGDEIKYTFDEPLNEKGTWSTTYADAGTYKISITASDGELDAKAELEVMVSDVDRAPVLELPSYFSVNEGEMINFTISAEDPDGDNLTIAVRNAPQGSQLNGTTFQWTPPFDTIKRRSNLFTDFLNVLGVEHYFLAKSRFPLVVEACGNLRCAEQKVLLDVYNVNRPPLLNIVENATIRETETFSLGGINGEDPDGDVVRYTFTAPLDKHTGVWKTSYRDAGVYVSSIKAMDGKLSDTKQIRVVVQNTNRPPTLKVAEDEIVALEGQEVRIPVSAVDPDNDTIKLSVRDLPSGASFVDGIFQWTPGGDFVVNASRDWKNTLWRIFPSLNEWFGKDQQISWVEFVASDAEFDTIHPVKIIVKNVNRKPEIHTFQPAGVVRAAVNQPLFFSVEGNDADGQKLSYRWIFGMAESRIEGAKTVQRIFSTPGQKKVSVVVSDGLENVKKTWIVNVLPEEKKEEIALGKFDLYVVE